MGTKWSHSAQSPGSLLSLKNSESGVMLRLAVEVRGGSKREESASSDEAGPQNSHPKPKSFLLPTSSKASWYFLPTSEFQVTLREGTLRFSLLSADSSKLTGSQLRIYFCFVMMQKGCPFHGKYFKFWILIFFPLDHVVWWPLPMPGSSHGFRLSLKFIL